MTGYVSASLNGQVYHGLKDIVLIKYSVTLGTIVWIRQHSTAQNDLGSGVVLDTKPNGNENVFIAGSVGASINGIPCLGGTSDTVMILYSWNGTRLRAQTTGTVKTNEAHDISIFPDEKRTVYLAG